MDNQLLKNNSIIPSRSERRVDSVKWSIAWKNWKELRGVSAEEKIFMWKVQQDMLLIGSRIHRLNADRRCKEELPGNICCQEIQTRHHLFIGCESVKDSFALCKLILRDILKKDISNNEVIFFSFNHRSKSKLKCATWFAVKAL